jgi:hypothetical protein
MRGACDLHNFFIYLHLLIPNLQPYSTVHEIVYHKNSGKIACVLVQCSSTISKQTVHGNQTSGYAVTYSCTHLVLLLTLL